MRQMLLHTQAFENRYLSTQKHLPRDALTYTRLYTQKLLDTDGFSENHRSFDTEKPLQRESFTHRSFYTHTQAFAQKLLRREAFEHRSFCTQTSLYTEACTHGGFYAQKLLHREAFTHRRFPTEKLIPQSNFYTLQKIAILGKLLTFGHHIRVAPALENRIFWRWTIILRKRVAPDLVKSQLYTCFISRETVVPDVPKWIKSQFDTNSWTFAPDV